MRNDFPIRVGLKKFPGRHYLSLVQPAKALIVLGAVLIAAGLIWLAAARLGLGHLPGDIVIERGNFRLYLPFGTCILISAFLTLIFWVLGRL